VDLSLSFTQRESLQGRCFSLLAFIHILHHSIVRTTHSLTHSPACFQILQKAMADLPLTRRINGVSLEHRVCLRGKVASDEDLGSKFTSTNTTTANDGHFCRSPQFFQILRKRWELQFEKERAELRQQQNGNNLG
jgi:hypothetical protein